MCNGYTNWDTWNTANWCLNVEEIKKAVLEASNKTSACQIIIRHMTYVKYAYNDCVELDKINLDEVIQAIKG